MNINQATIDLVKEFEGFRAKAYRDPVGIWTVGYGTTSRAGVGLTVDQNTTVSHEEAEYYLTLALEKFRDQILPLFTRKPTENQFGAMLSLAYNIGPGAFAKSTCLKRFNAGDTKGAAEALTWFNKAGGKKLAGLVRRREAERELFLRGNTKVDLHEDRAKPDPERHPAQSKTVQGAVGAAVAGAGGLFTALGQLDPTTQYIVAGLAAVALVGLTVVLWERIKKFADGDR